MGQQRPVALFMPSLHGGGAERVMLDIAAGLVERDIAVDLVLVRASGHYREIVPEQARLIDLNSHRTAASLPKLIGYVRRERPISLMSTLVHANVIALSAMLLFRRRPRMVVRIANTYGEELAGGSFKHRLALRLLKVMLPTADGIVCVSDGVSEDLRSRVPSAAHKIETVYNPVVSPGLSKQSEEPVDHPWFDDGGPPVILAAGRLTRVKDHATLLRAFAKVTESRPARLIVLGEGPERENLLRLADSYGMSQQVDLPGFMTNPFAHMSRASVFVLSSRYEGFPNVLVQAMACATPVISTDCRSGPAEILEDGRWGHLVPVGDWSSMADAILQTLDNPQSSEQLVSRASVYSAATSVDRYLAVLLGRAR